MLLRRKQTDYNFDSDDHILSDNLETEYGKYEPDDIENQEEEISNMDANTSEETTNEVSTTTIHEGMKMQGDVKGSHNLQLNGELEGKIDLSALLVIGKTGRFKGEVKAKNIIIEGVVEGKLSASEKVEIRNEGHYSGDIIAPSINISDKAYFQGNVQMSKNDTERQGSYKSYPEKRKSESSTEKATQKSEAVTVVE